MTQTNKAAFTIKFMWIMTSIIIGVDIYLAVNSFKGDTISEITMAYSYRWITIPTAYGILTGHLFWPIRGERRFTWLRLTILALFMTGVVYVDAFTGFGAIPIIPVMIGVPIGRLLWPQMIPKEASLIAWKK